MKRVWRHKGYQITAKTTTGFGVRYRVAKGERFYGSAPSVTEAKQIINALPAEPTPCV